MPPEKRTTDFSVSKDIPVLDLGQEAGRGRSALIQQIIKAGEEFGAFQVCNANSLIIFGNTRVV